MHWKYWFSLKMHIRGKANLIQTNFNLAFTESKNKDMIFFFSFFFMNSEIQRNGKFYVQKVLEEHVWRDEGMKRGWIGTCYWSWPNHKSQSTDGYHSQLEARMCSFPGKKREKNDAKVWVDVKVLMWVFLFHICVPKTIQGEGKERETWKIKKQYDSKKKVRRLVWQSRIWLLPRLNVTFIKKYLLNL